MCTDGVSFLILSDERIQQAMANPILDFVHKQVLMTLYSMEAAGNLNEYNKMLPLYLSADSTSCEAIVDTLEAAGLVSRSSGNLELTYKIDAGPAGASCGCHSHM